MFFFCCLVKPPLKELCMWEFCDLTATSHANIHFATETQHTDCRYHCKDFKGKEWNLLLLLPRIKRLLCAIYKKGNACKRKLCGGRVLKPFLRHGRIVQKLMQEEERKIDQSSCKSFTWTKKKKKAAIERTTQLVAKKQLGWLYSFAKTCMHSNCSGNLQGNCGMAFGRVCSSSFEGSPLSFWRVFALGRIFD